MYRSNSKRNELRLIAISLGYKDVTSRNKETMDLLDYGFNQYEIDMLYEKKHKSWNSSGRQSK